MASAAQVIGEAVVGADKAATLWLNGIWCPASDAVWLFFSNKLVWIPLYLVVLFFFFRRLGWKRALVAIAALALTILCCDQLAGVFKNWVCRPRPCFDEWMIACGLHIPVESSTSAYGFFSAHAANTFGFAACSLGVFRSDSAHSYRAYAWGVFVWAALVSLSRVFIARHFLGDILVGAAVGILIGALIALVFRRVTAE